MQRRWTIGALAALAMVAALAIPTLAEDKDLKTKLSGYNEVPAISTPASGEFQARIANDESEIEFELSYEGFATGPSAAHIHLGQRGVNGGVIAFLCGGGSKPACPAGSATLTGTINATDVIGPAGQGIAAGELAEAIAALRAGVVYANAHSSTFPGGEIRGQIK